MAAKVMLGVQTKHWDWDAIFDVLHLKKMDRTRTAPPPAMTVDITARKTRRKIYTDKNASLNLVIEMSISTYVNSTHHLPSSSWGKVF